MSRRERKAERERLRAKKQKLIARAARIYAEGGPSSQRALRLSVAAARGNEATLSELLFAAQKGDEALLEAAEHQVAVMPKPPRWAPPPEGWGPLREVLEAERQAAMAEGGRSSTYSALVQLAHFSVLHRALMARAAWEMWGSSNPARWQQFVERLAREPLIPEEREAMPKRQHPR